MSREQDFLLGAIQKDKVIAQQQARIEELKLALDKADPLDPSFLRYLELEQQLQAEREKVAILAKWNAKFRADIKRLEASQSAIAWAEQLHRAQIAETELQAERERVTAALREVNDSDHALQAEREKSAALHQRFAEAVQAKERLETLAGLATEASLFLRGTHDIDREHWLARFDALTTQAPEAGQ